MNRRLAVRLVWLVFLLLAVHPLHGVWWPDSLPSQQRPSSPSTPPRRPDESVIVNIPATSPWTDTGVAVAAGDRVTIRAWGQVKPHDQGSTGVVGPAGSGLRGGGCGWVVTGAAAAHALVGNVAPRVTFDGSGFQVGSRWAGAVPVAGTSSPEGQLLLGFNANAMLCDRSGYDSWAFRIANSGAFTVEIAISRSRRPAR